MNDTLWYVAATAILLIVTHNGLAYPPVRRMLVARFEEWPFRMLYAMIAVAALTLLVLAYLEAPAVPLWQPPTALRHVSLTLMPLAWVLLVCGYTAPNPTAVGLDLFSDLEGTGILKVTRHPVLWAVMLWCVSHLLANGDAAGTILFGAILAMTGLGIANIERKKRAEHGARWQRFVKQTSNVPFVALIQGRAKLTMAEIGWWRIGVALAIHVAVLYFHGAIFGVAPLPSFSF